MNKLGFLLAVLVSAGLALAGVVMLIANSGNVDCIGVTEVQCLAEIKMSKMAWVSSASLALMALFAAPRILKRAPLLGSYPLRVMIGGIIGAALFATSYVATDVSSTDIEPVCESQSAAGCSLLRMKDLAAVERICQANPSINDPNTSVLTGSMHPACSMLDPFSTE
jgi:hypothetical protein